MNGLLREFRELKKSFNGKFLVTREVVNEIVDKPMKIKRFELEALKLKELITDKVLEMPSSLGIDENKLSKMTSEMMKLANNTFFGKKSAIHLIDSGETSCLVLSKLLSEKGTENVLSVDERTTRLLGEKPENLLILLEKKLHTPIRTQKENLKMFENFKFIRSTELIYIAYKKGIIKLKNHNILDALLYALKFNGASISDGEIKEMEKLR